jgi:amino-acid N-acetyltransferase
MASVARATLGERATIHGLLAAAGLPIDDLDAAPVRFWVARDGAKIIGAVGLEVHGAAGLLRSLVVKAAQRRAGVGTALVQALERQSCRDGLELLVLLTETAQTYFARQGYAIQERGDVPASIQQTAQFKSLCPASAVCMSKVLAR